MTKTVVLWHLLALGFCPSLLAQDALTATRGTLVTIDGVQTDNVDAPEFGTLNWSAYSLSAHAFRPESSQVTYEDTTVTGNLSIYRTNSTGETGFAAPIHLPTGALMTTFEFRFCDTSATKKFDSALQINNKAGGGEGVWLVNSGLGETPGCVSRAFVPATPIPVNNGSNAYTLLAFLGGTPGDNTIVLSQARIYYLLQVSPAPATATFPVDVPTSHPFFQFVEAVARSGITAGCGPGSYCPDAPLTRGQMAVFLAVALGLHFPN
jgi:hypothetical protein